MKTFLILTTLLIPVTSFGKAVRLKAVACKNHASTVICKEKSPRTVLDKAFDLKILDLMGYEKDTHKPKEPQHPKKLYELLRETARRVKKAQRRFKVQDYSIIVSGGIGGGCFDGLGSRQDCIAFAELVIDDKAGNRVAGSSFPLSENKVRKRLIVETPAGELLLFTVE